MGDDIVAWLILTLGEVVTHRRPREATDPDGRAVTIHDTVLRARHRG